MIIISTSRLHLREFKPADAPSLAKMNSDPEVLRYVLHPKAWTLKDAEDFISGYDLYERYGYGRWAVTLREKDELIGWCGLKYRPENRQVDLGYRFAREFWGNGFATEAARASMDHGFMQLGLPRVVASYIPGNSASLNVLNKLGFQSCGTWSNGGREFSLLEAKSPCRENQKKQPLLETERLLLREFHPGDARVMLALNSDPEVTRYTGDDPFLSLEQAREFLSDYLKFYERPGYARWAVVLKETGETLGWCGLKFIPELNETDLGFRFFKRHWGKGYATEAGTACLDYGFEKSGLRRIVARAMKANSASVRALEKCGMKFVKEMEFELHPGVLFERVKNKGE